MLASAFGRAAIHERRVSRPWSKVLAAIVVGIVPGVAFGADPVSRLPIETLKIEAQFPGPSGVQRDGDFLAYGYDAVWAITAKGLIRVDPSDNRITNIKIDGAVGGFRQPAIGEGGVWIADIGSELVFKIDPASYETVLKFRARMLTAEGSVAVASGSVWVVTAEEADSTLTRFSAATGAVEATIQLPSDGGGVLADFGSVWVVGRSKGEVYRIDPATNAIVQTIPGNPLPNFLAAGDGSVWVINSKDDVVQRIDGATGETLTSIDSGAQGQGGGIATGGGYVWVSKGGTPVVQIDPATNAALGSYGGVGLGGSIHYAAGSLWVTGVHALYRIKPPG